MKSAKDRLETPMRIEPARLEQIPEEIGDVIAELSAATAALGAKLHPATASQLAGAVRMMNCYYSNLIEGHNTRPRDIERALAGELDRDQARRDLQREATAHIRVQAKLDQMASLEKLPEPASPDFLKWLHREFYAEASQDMLAIKSDRSQFTMVPGEWRSGPEHNVAVGRHIPPSSDRVEDFMRYFAERYRFASMGKGARILAIATAHHQFNYIHPFPDGNGRVSRLMSHAMALKAGIGAHGLWSISRGLARGLESRADYKTWLDHADTPRQGDLDGRGNLSERALKDFSQWFLRVCLDQVQFMTGLFDLEALNARFERYVRQSDSLRPEAVYLLQEASFRGEIERGAAARITGLPERTARRVLTDLTAQGLLGSDTPKAPVSLRFPVESLEMLFPRLYPQT